MKREFKVGDRVRVIDCKSTFFGDELDITSIHESHLYPIKTKGMIFRRQDLELIKEATPIKNISLERLDELTKAVNTLGSLGVEVKLKITVEIDGKKIEL